LVNRVNRRDAIRNVRFDRSTSLVAMFAGFPTIRVQLLAANIAARRR
jgi:hypothetical protein